MSSFDDNASLADKLQNMITRLPVFEREVLGRLITEGDATLQKIIEEESDSSRTFNIMKLIATKATDLCHASWLAIFADFSTG
jgi:hypothetical protein